MSHHHIRIPVISGILGWFDSEGVNYGMVLIIVGGIMLFVSAHFLGLSQGQVISFLLITSPIWLPYILFHLFFEKYMEMLGLMFAINNGRVTLEIKLPQEVYKSPEAMEYVFSQIYNAQSPDNLMDTYIDGKRPLIHSFELVSQGGNVKFYVNLPAKKSPDAFIANMYAQYPGVEIIKLDVDYTAAVPHDLKGKTFMSFHCQKKESEEFPIKTYIDFGMDKLPKEEEKNDPMAPLLEVLASVDPHKELWMQFLCKAHRKKEFKLGQLHKEGTWEKRVLKKIDELMGRDSKTKLGPPDIEGMPRLTTGEHDTIEAMERNASKYAFEFQCRWVYISHKENDFDGGLFSRIIRAISVWDDRTRNGIGVVWRTDFNYMFLSDPFHKIIPALKKSELKGYKVRRLNPHTSAMEPKIMSAEEMATIFHLPGRVAMTPTINRVPSTRGEAPSNLPTGNFSP